MKTCSKCGETKALDEFHLCKTSKDGHVWSCKVCAIARARQHYRDNTSRHAALARAYKAKNAEWYSALNKKYHNRSDKEKKRREALVAHHVKREQLSDSYVVQMIRQSLRRDGLDMQVLLPGVPKQLIEAKREHLRMFRLIKERQI